MKIKEAFTLLESSLNETNINIVLNGLDQSINHSNEEFSALLNGDSRYKRGLFSVVANDKTMKRMAASKFVDPKYSTLLSHFLLAKISGFSDIKTDYLSDIVEVINTNLKSVNKCGTTIGYAIGCCIGRLLYNGCDSTPLAKICNHKNIKNEEVFLKGFMVGFNNDLTGLMSDSTYKADLSERYNEWNEGSQQICYKLFNVVAQKDNASYHQINIANEKMTWFLHNYFSESELIKNIHMFHNNKMHKMINETMQSPEVVKFIELQVIQNTNALMNEVEKNYDKKLQKEIARVEQQAIDNAQIILAQQAALNLEKEQTEKKVQFQNKLNRLL